MSPLANSGRSNNAQRVGKYLLLDQIGRGSSSEVMLAEDTSTGRRVAMKILEKLWIYSNDVGTMVVREIEVMKDLDHPSVVRLIEVLNSKTHIFMVMELVEGRDLHHEIAAMGKLSDNRARSLFLQVLEGLSYLHSKRVAHRDIKLENLLLSKDGRTVKIADFGLAAWLHTNKKKEGLHSETSHGDSEEGDSIGADEDEVKGGIGPRQRTVCGTPYYTAPEVFAGSKSGYEADRVDVWSAGVVLYTMKAGCLPFEGQNTGQTLEMITSREVSYPRHFSPNLRDLVGRLLRKSPEERMSLEQALSHPWIKGQSELGTNMDCPRTPRPTYRKPRAAPDFQMWNPPELQNLSTPVESTGYRRKSLPPDFTLPDRRRDRHPEGGNPQRNSSDRELRQWPPSSQQQQWQQLHPNPNQDHHNRSENARHRRQYQLHQNQDHQEQRAFNNTSSSSWRSHRPPRISRPKSVGSGLSEKIMRRGSTSVPEGLEALGRSSGSYRVVISAAPTPNKQTPAAPKAMTARGRGVGWWGSGGIDSSSPWEGGVGQGGRSRDVSDQVSEDTFARNDERPPNQGRRTRHLSLTRSLQFLRMTSFKDKTPGLSPEPRAVAQGRRGASIGPHHGRRNIAAPGSSGKKWPTSSGGFWSRATPRTTSSTAEPWLSVSAPGHVGPELQGAGRGQLEEDSDLELAAPSPSPTERTEMTVSTEVVASMVPPVDRARGVPVEKATECAISLLEKDEEGGGGPCGVGQGQGQRQVDSRRGDNCGNDGVMPKKQGKDAKLHKGFKGNKMAVLVGMVTRAMTGAHYQE
ncbi:unnamed protein product [Discosporangium mesarthrocarpum]